MIAAGRQLGLDVQMQTLLNPRKEREQHYYNPAHSGLLELGLHPHPMTEAVLVEMLERVQAHAGRIDPGRIMPRVSWNPALAVAAQ